MDKYKLKVWKRKIRRPFEWLGIYLAILIFTNVSHKMLFRICDLISALGYRFDKKGRALSRRNLHVVLGGAPISPKREEIILRRSYRNMMRTLGHVFWTSRNALKRSRAVAKLSDVCKNFLDANQPSITVSCHMGCWEVLSQLVYLEGRKIVSVAKDVGSKGMTELLMKSRRSLGQQIVPAEGAFLPLMQGLKEGADVGLLVDQVVKPKNGGAWVRFFGKPVPVSVAPAFLCAKTHAPIVVAWSRPLKDGTYRCEYINSYEWKKGLDVWGLTQDMIHDLERVIRRHPSCWVLNYRYFRYSPSEADLSQLEAREKKRKSGTEEI